MTLGIDWIPYAVFVEGGFIFGGEGRKNCGGPDLLQLTALFSWAVSKKFHWNNVVDIEVLPFWGSDFDLKHLQMQQINRQSIPVMKTMKADRRRIATPETEEIGSR